MNRPDITSLEYHLEMLGARKGNPHVAENIQVIGIIGNPDDASVLTPYLESSNPYVVQAAAVALVRLGHKNEGVYALRGIVDQVGTPETLYYLVNSLRLLAEIDSEYFRDTIVEFSEKINRLEFITPAQWSRLTHIAWRHGFEINQ
ncbi:MAG: hypothetical protein ABFR33_05215 [Verrucomicrobiota bacterium]